MDYYSSVECLRAIIEQSKSPKAMTRKSFFTIYFNSSFISSQRTPKSSIKDDQDTFEYSTTTFLLKTISSMISDNDMMKDELGERGVCSVVVDILEAQAMGPCSERIVEAAMEAISNLSFHHAKNKERFQLLSAGRVVSSFPTICSKSPKTAIHASRAIANVSLPPSMGSTRDESCSEEVSLFLSSMLSAHSENIEVLTSAIAAVLNVAASGPEAQSSLGEAGLCRDLLRVLEQHSSSRDVCYIALMALATLTRGHEQNQLRAGPVAAVLLTLQTVLASHLRDASVARRWVQATYALTRNRLDSKAAASLRALLARALQVHELNSVLVAEGNLLLLRLAGADLSRQEAHRQALHSSSSSSSSSHGKSVHSLGFSAHNPLLVAQLQQ